jgi:hypothetical protein
VLVLLILSNNILKGFTPVKQKQKLGFTGQAPVKQKQKLGFTGQAPVKQKQKLGFTGQARLDGFFGFCLSSYPPLLSRRRGRRGRKEKNTMPLTLVVTMGTLACMASKRLIGNPSVNMVDWLKNKCLINTLNHYLW